ncbi:MAG: hypothetical protein JSC085_000054 [Candidatus Tokpelaia sp. JSC085]|nr:MAG: hypothetical protein JSC085_000054 [Candidatus Tokpelaia sp. JSC085]
MVKSELGTKRVDPETGRKFYDLNRDPIISPYTGISYPRSYFEKSSDKKEVVSEEEGARDVGLRRPKFGPLDGVDDDRKDSGLPDIVDDDVDLCSEDDDTFLPDDDVSGIIGSGINSDNDH